MEKRGRRRFRLRPVARQRQQLQNDAAAQRAVIVKAFEDAFGRAPDAAESAVAAAAPDRDGTYVALMRQHVRSLAAHPDEYRQVLDRAYRRVIRRGVYDEEVAYWEKHDTLPFALLAGCIDNWARRNQPGLMVTAGTPTLSVHSDCLATVRLSRAIAEEARGAAGLATANTDYFSYASNRTVIAAGAGDLVSNGRIHFAAAGAPDLVPVGAMN
jgi:hypothetical protein